MTNDILEQIVDDYFRDLGYFTQHNVPYRPDDFKSMHSDIDVIAINPRKKGLERVVVISCKSWQSGILIYKMARLYNICGNFAGDLYVSSNARLMRHKILKILYI